MLVKESSNSVVDKELIEGFRKSFASFCKKAPVKVCFNIFEDIISVKVNGKKADFYFTDNVRTTIFNIKMWLVNYNYPRLVKREFIESHLNADEIVNILEKNKSVTVDEVIKKKKIVELANEYIIIRFLEATQEVFLLDVSSKKVKKFKMGYIIEKVKEGNLPMTYQEFLAKYEEGKEEIMGDLFFEKSKYVFDVYNDVTDTKIDDFSWVKSKFL